ncbi:hypothetical protein [Cytobacillus sp. IB215665]|uniref:hypothetical protein n=1 Tax=Cytobacillus sp. IB215665 TaxID=3097357 RepID=UPI002A0F6534|nr:hypothetical protein [Cytobacillus sp. IB215665]MDX8366584.1 hypothetical protein [Cytobacillus sp. IB215665]
MSYIYSKSKCGCNSKKKCVSFTKTFTNLNPITINQDAIATPYPSNISVSGLKGEITKVTATIIGLSHTHPNDIQILLLAPSGSTIFLMNDIGFNVQINDVTLTLTDDAEDIIPSPIFSGTFKPTIDPDNPPPPAPHSPQLSIFNSEDPNGIWSLFIFDNDGSGQGNIAGGWQITITTEMCV